MNSISNMFAVSESRTTSLRSEGVSAGGKPPVAHSRFFLCRKKSTLSEDRMRTSASDALTAVHGGS